MIEEKEKTKIVLEKDEVALVLNKNWGIRLYFPDISDDEDVDSHILYFTELAILTQHDGTFIDKILEGFHKRAGLADEEQADK